MSSVLYFIIQSSLPTQNVTTPRKTEKYYRELYASRKLLGIVTDQNMATSDFHDIGTYDQQNVKTAAEAIWHFTL